MDRRDIYEVRPAGMDQYLASYGWHFSKKMYEWAVSMMSSRTGEKITPVAKEEFDSMMQRYGSTTLVYKGYDALYVFAMAKADFLGSSLQTEQQACRFVRDYLEDKDGYDGVTFTRFYADCIAKGMPILWEEMM